MKISFIKKRFFHVYSYGKMTGEIFKTTEDHLAAMNITAACAARWPSVKIVAQCDMTTHIHKAIYGRAKDCAGFVADLEKRLLRYINHNRRKEDRLKQLYITMDEIGSGDELKFVVAYILRNPPQSNLPYLPWDYPWGSGPLFFMPPSWELQVLDLALGDPDNLKHEETIEAEKLAYRTIRSVSHCKQTVPPKWKVYRGLILQSNYISTKLDLVDYSSRRDYLFHIGLIKSDRAIDEKMESSYGAIISDRDLNSAIRKLSKSKFTHSRLRDLTHEERIEVAVEIYNQYKPPIWQLSRAAQINFDDLAEVIFEA